MPYDPVRDAVQNASPREPVAPLPSLQSHRPALNGNGISHHYIQPEIPSPSSITSLSNAQASGSRPERVVSERRGNSLAHILTNDDRPWSSHSGQSTGASPVHHHSPTLRTPVEDVSHTRLPPVGAVASASYQPHRPPDLQPITLPPADSRPSYIQYRDRETGTYSPHSTRVSVSPVATRSNSPTRTHSPEDILNFPHRPRPSLSPVAVREAEEILYSYPHRPSRSPISHRGTPLTLSPVQSLRSIDDRPTTSQQPVIAPLLPSPPLRPASPPAATMLPNTTETISEVHKPIPLPYAPRNRKTPADSVLIPLSPAELETYRTSHNPLRAKHISPDSIPLTLPPSDAKKRPSKRRRDTVDDPHSSPKRARDVMLVADHYNTRPNVNVQQRQDSPIIGLKNFNNWIKAVLIAQFATPTLADVSPSETNDRRHNRPKGRVLDLGCGKGGDLQKWQKSRAELFVGLDIAETSISQARERATSLRSAGGFRAEFFTLDCYSRPLSDVLDKTMLEKPFDVVSMQFCMHYAFENISKVRMMLENVARYLRPGGRFVGTIPNASWLLERLHDIPSDALELSFGNSVYKITFENKQHALFGQRYSFFLLDAVDDVPEYVVHWENFVELAEEHGLKLVERKEFHDIFTEHQNHKDYGPLLKRMKVVDDQGDSQMDEDQWEAANIYVGFVFEKR